MRCLCYFEETFEKESGFASLKKLSETELPVCPVETTLLLIGNKWKVLILRDLLEGTKRFGEFRKSLGAVSQKVLTTQLRDMEDSGLVKRQVYAEMPPRVEYSLTDLGDSLQPILEAMDAWCSNYQKLHQGHFKYSQIKLTDER